jgi:hypothetical protein
MSAVDPPRRQKITTRRLSVVELINRSQMFSDDVRNRRLPETVVSRQSRV